MSRRSNSFSDDLLGQAVSALDVLFDSSSPSFNGPVIRLERLFKNDPVGSAITLSFTLRKPSLWRELGRQIPTVLLHEYEEAYSTVDRPLIVAVLGSFVRSGWVRSAAVTSLENHTGSLAMAALVLRLTDPVEAVSKLAWHTLESRLRFSNVSEIAACVSLIPRLGGWERGDRWPVRSRMTAILTRGDASALWEASRSPLRETRRAALFLLADKYAESPQLGGVLRSALADSDPRTRKWVAERVANRKQILSSVADSLIPLLLDDPNPSIRLIALRRMARDRSSSAATLIPFVCDPNANVRYYARRFLARRGVSFDSRRLALEILATQDTSVGALVGALGALSESGSPNDQPAIAPFAANPSRKVAREARRTLQRL